MTEIRDFILARIAEDEAYVRDAADAGDPVAQNMRRGCGTKRDILAHTDSLPPAEGDDKRNFLAGMWRYHPDYRTEWTS